MYAWIKAYVYFYFDMLDSSFIDILCEFEFVRK